MAVVKITTDLVDLVRRKAASLFDNKFVEMDRIEPQFAQAVVDAVFSQWQADRACVPMSWLPVTDRINVCVTLPAGTNYNQTVDWAHSGLWDGGHVPFGEHTFISLPGVTYKGPQGYSSAFINVQAAAIVEGCPLFDLCAQLRRHREMFEALVAERERAVSSVVTAVSSFSTLGPALRAYPALWDLLPEHVKTRHKEVVARTKPAKATPPQADLTTITSIITAKKILGDDNV